MYRTWERHPARDARVVLVLAPVLAVFAFGVASVSFLVDRGFAVVHQCLSAPGAWGVVGMNLALVRRSPDCPADAVVLGGEPSAAVTVLGVLALPVILGHVVALVAGWRASSALRRALERVRLVAMTATRIVRLLVRRLAQAVATTALAPRSTRGAVVAGIDVPSHHLVLATAVSRRGPPGAVATA